MSRSERRSAILGTGSEVPAKIITNHAQLSAAPFYERAGFVRRGPEFDETGIAHVEMLRAL